MTFDKLKKRWQERERQRERENAVRKADLRAAAPAVFARYGVKKAVLFGSLAEGRSRSGSDVDLLVMPLPASEFWAFWHELEDAVGKPIDLLTDTDDPTMVKKILDRGEVIYEA